MYFFQAPSISWSEVTRELDHPGFQITSRQGFELLIRGLRRGLANEVFPIDMLYSPWKNKEGQVFSIVLVTPYKINILLIVPIG